MSGTGATSLEVQSHVTPGRGGRGTAGTNPSASVALKPPAPPAKGSRGFFKKARR